MIEIRKLTLGDMRQAIELKALCWPEEVGSFAGSGLDIEREYLFWTDWMAKGPENNDVRLLYGAFENGNMLGVAFGSFAEAEDIPEGGIELNGLWVYPQHRGRGISFMLINRILDDYLKLGMKQMVIYNFHDSTSNSFYRKWGCQVIRQDRQTKDELPVDVFLCDISEVNQKMKAALTKYIK